jgi:6-phosphofructokinase 1
MEVYQDARVYDTGMICVIEVMGRHAGWLTAATALAARRAADRISFIFRDRFRPG